MRLSVRSYVSFIILQFTYTINSLAVPPGSLPVQDICTSNSFIPLRGQSTSSVTAWPPDKDYRCFEHGFFGGSLARNRNCATAMTSLPGEHLPGTFHSGGQDDPYRLPVSLISGNCNITVEIPASVTDDTTWSCIGQRIDILVKACKKGTDQDGHVGGQTWAGAGREMTITIIKTGREIPAGLYRADGEHIQPPGIGSYYNTSSSETANPEIGIGSVGTS